VCVDVGCAEGIASSEVGEDIAGCADQFYLAPWYGGSEILRCLKGVSGCTAAKASKMISQSWLRR
jgi:hypothetical protein